MPRTKLFALVDPETGYRYYKLVNTFMYKGYKYWWEDAENAYYSPYAVQYFEKMPVGAYPLTFYITSDGRVWHHEQPENEASHD